MKNILVYGFYHKNNMGDDLFIDAFKFLFPLFNFTFVDEITANSLQNVDAVFLGGGSFLNQQLDINLDIFTLLLTKNIFYIGVGAETHVHDTHHKLMSVAKLIAIRSPVGLEKVKSINPNVIVIPDLVYCLTPFISNYRISNSVLILPNISVVPTWHDQHYMHTAWAYFKTEFAQFLDGLVHENFHINFLPFSTNFKLDDDLAAAEIIGAMQNRNSFSLLKKPETLSAITDLISQYNIVITQRYHGIILSNMVHTPYISIYHHDKLKDFENSLPYYGLTKDKLKEKFNKTKDEKTAKTILPDIDAFMTLKQAVADALC
jgi:polysaccharide pyruvyl transferase WcaK-like protein